ncbi:hypothetical protein [Acidianus brierleyi]|uniref:Flagellin n=1 Tax=Acidianus brierleyi TaxID=41673 RepID=A0A2U9IDY5_9CREN|nr:hypothetical protein [Acidianus brierleyi]AWR94247.1 hypothetical protein DFR85_06215 [Acidianus brierleyi]
MAFGVGEIIILAVTVIIGLVIFSFVSAFLVPQLSFTNAEQTAKNMGSDISVTAGPLFLENGKGSSIFYIYSPQYSGNFTVIAFAVPTSDIASIGTITPSYSVSTLNVFLTNGKIPLSKTFSTIYSTSGEILSTNQVGYEVPSNEAFSVTSVTGLINSSDIIVVWIIYQSGNYYFRIYYTYSGVSQ